ncbi:zinc-binding dehydrogenase [Actinomadura roseirufa]|uniref:zinc-binding dehydrogenase n=1 Tax=Actinomadura roseirufa TaxID=2094049 RepID=UPI0010418B02|nr:zinc-binding dehydrogenase [Actinomadura roseirufa]
MIGEHRERVGVIDFHLDDKDPNMTSTTGGRDGGLPSTFRTSVLTGPRTSALSLTSVPDCGPGEVLIRVMHNGICASELHAWQEGPGSQVHVLGHEAVGEIKAVGPGVTAHQVGDIVTGRILRSFAEYALADQRDLVRVPSGLSPDTVLGEPVGCVVECLRRTPIDVADEVAVIGAGFMGLCLLQLLSHSRTARVTAIDPRPEAREHAAKHGADVVRSPAAGTEPVTGEAFHVVFETSGSQAGLDLATRLVRQHGTVSILGYHQGSRSVDMEAWNFKAIDVINAHVRDPDRLRTSTERGLALAAAGRLDLDSLITHRYSLAQVDRAFAALDDKPAGFIKAVLDIGPP